PPTLPGSAASPSSSAAATADAKPPERGRCHPGCPRVRIPRSGFPFTFPRPMNAPAKHSILPILLLSAAGFTVLTTEFVIVGLLPSMARDLGVTVPQAGLLVTLFAFTVAAVGPALTAWLARYDRKKLFISTLLLFGISNVIA